MWQYVKAAFQLFCFILAVFMTWNHIGNYYRNDDSSYVSLERFNSRPQDNYPTFTICFKSENGFIYSRNVEELHVTRNQYAHLLRGGSTEKNTSDEYFQRVVNNDFELFSMKISAILSKFEFTTKTEKGSISYNARSKNKELVDAEFNIAYQDADRVCYSRKSEVEKMLGSIRKHDSVHLNVRDFFESDNDINLYLTLEKHNNTNHDGFEINDSSFIYSLQY